MAHWDVFHGDRLEVERGLSTAEVRAALARGNLRDDDLIRPAGTAAPWARLCDLPALLAPEPGSGPETGPPPPGPPVGHEQEFAVIDDDFESVAAPDFADDRDGGDATGPSAAEPGDLGEFDLDPRMDPGSRVALPVVASRDWEGPTYGPDGEVDDEDEEATAFTVSRGAPEKVEELDLAAMVDVAFQLVLFFLVTATTVLFKSLEVPRPNPESPPRPVPSRGRRGASTT